jgi:hypothetical protein
MGEATTPSAMGTVRVSRRGFISKVRGSVMTSRYRCSSGDKREEAQVKLHAHGYIEAICGDSGQGKTLVVQHPEAYVGRVDDLVRRADPSAQRI